ncbi:MAG TPA: sulfite exporter TauE/SafE family protein [Clostridia bacterium]
MKKFPEKITLLICGALIGFINGFFGGGGGMIAVPVLERILKNDTKIAHATAILIILPLCISSAIVYIVSGYFKLDSGLPAGAGVIAGGILGAALLAKLNSKTIRIIFAVAMTLVGLKMAIFP